MLPESELKQDPVQHPIATNKSNFIRAHVCVDTGVQQYSGPGYTLNDWTKATRNVVF